MAFLGLQVEMLLAQVPLLSNLEQGKLTRLAQATKTRQYSDGDSIIVEHDVGDCMYIVQDGEAVVSVDGVGEVARKRKGDYFGEQALLDDAPRSATIHAAGPMACLELSRVVFEGFVSAMARLELLLAQVGHYFGGSFT